jgi:hypothetical protein
MPRPGAKPGPSHPLVEEIRMKDAMGAQVLGGTKWKRFALVMVPTVGIAGAMSVMMAQGALAASFAVSGQQFQVSADTLDGQDFQQTGNVVVQHNGTAHAVAEAGIKSATITNMCQSVSVPTPFGNLVVVLTAGGGGTPAQATDLVLNTNDVKADAVFTGVQIGKDAADLQGVAGMQTQAGAFGQEVQHAVLTGVKQTAWSTTASTMTLKGLHIAASFNGATCF